MTPPLCHSRIGGGSIRLGWRWVTQQNHRRRRGQAVEGEGQPLLPEAGGALGGVGPERLEGEEGRREDVEEARVPERHRSLPVLRPGQGPFRWGAGWGETKSLEGWIADRFTSQRAPARST